ncbi:MAG: CAP domain-containing protein, partial [Thermodesulfobacteriota bacterium]
NPAPPTNQPIAAPTPAPTAQPTSQPTSPTPFPIPTQAPNPTPAPTPLPTAAPTPRPTSSPPGGLNDFQSEVLDLVNNARAQARNCGSDFFPSAPPVGWDERIQDAAQLHSEDMADNQNFSHTGTNGSDTGDRLLMQNYNWNSWGENILVGLDNAPDAVDAWIGSSGHCSIIMSPSLREVGAGFAQGIFQGRTSFYWTLVFATER